MSSSEARVVTVFLGSMPGCNPASQAGAIEASSDAWGVHPDIVEFKLDVEFEKCNTELVTDCCIAEVVFVVVEFEKCNTGLFVGSCIEEDVFLVVEFE